jgi:hypothetical protein
MLNVGSTAGSSGDGDSSQGSLSDAIVISDGGYLADESEAELQRLAGAQAALVAQNQAEEQKFKAARRQRAAVRLRPPKSWDETDEVIPRMQIAGNHAVSCSHHPAYTMSYSMYASHLICSCTAHTVDSQRPALEANSAPQILSMQPELVSVFMTCMSRL